METGDSTTGYTDKHDWEYRKSLRMRIRKHICDFRKGTSRCSGVSFANKPTGPATNTDPTKIISTDVLLVNAKAIKNIGEKKTDEVDAEWIILLHSYGLLKASFQPDNQARRIRNLSRHRDNLLKTSSREVLHMHKPMELMNIKLSNVISDILGKSGQAIIAAIISGERDAHVLAALADPRCKSSKETIEKSLVANWDKDLLFLLEQSYHLYKYLQSPMQACERQIETILLQYQKL